ncbi:glycosyltransferase family 4 protein [Pseudovibrio sp. SCP19]|uniref:glycosyltransferase family 4 protein n=1 Tax=Pseudovibrio sp. SCP19 TaxID=3141374 RepID=UPI003335D676
MILLDNIIFELQRFGGISKYWAKTIERVDASSLDISFLESDSASQNFFRSCLRLTHPQQAEDGGPTMRRLTRSKQHCDIFHSSYYRTSRNARANVVTIHDFMNEKFPTSLRDKVLAYLKKQACRRADAVVVVSEQTRRDLLEAYPFVDPGCVHVTYNGVDEEFYPEPLINSFEVGENTFNPRDYFLYVGTRGFCKNFPFVLRFMKEAKAQGLIAPLILVGGGPLSPSEWAEIEACGLSIKSVQQLTGVSNDVLRRLYSNCLALLIPSIYEGFGLPAAEAARCGSLVLSARGSALDEIVGETEYAFELSLEGEASRVLRLGLHNANAEQERKRLQARSLMFDWDASTTKLMEIYNDL